MRTVLAIALIAGSLPVAGALESPLTSRGTVNVADLTAITAHPESFVGDLVRFRCTWVGTGVLYDRFRSMFVPERHVNVSIWDDRAPLWSPAARAEALPTVYIDRNLPLKTDLLKLRKYEIVEVTGRVMSAQDGLAWITIDELHPVAGAGAWSDAAIYHVEQANSLLKDPNGPAYDLADEHFVAALTTELPPVAGVEVRELRANALMAANRHAEAAAALAEALVIAGNDRETLPATVARLHALSAKALGEIKRYQQAAEHAETALRIDPSIGEAYAVLGISLAGLERYEDARRQCDKAVRLRPQDAEVRWYLGRILDLQGKHDEAIDALKKAIDLTPKDYRLHKAIAAVYYHRSLAGGGQAATDVFTSLREYEITTRLNAADGDTWLQSALVIDAAAKLGFEVPTAGGREKASRDLATARLIAGVTAAPKHIPLHETLAARYTEDNRPEDALKHLRDLSTIEAASFARVEAVARALRALKKDAEVIAAYQGFRDRNPKSGPGVVALAKALEDAGKRAEAIEALESFFAAGNRDDQADSLRSQLRAAQRSDEDAKARSERAAREQADAEAKAKLRAEAAAKEESDRKAAVEAKAKLRAEEEAKEKAAMEAKAKIRAEEEAKEKAAIEAKAKIRAEEEAKEKAATEAKAKQRAEEEAKAAADKKARDEAKAKAKAEEEAKAAADKKARDEAKAKAKADEEARIAAEKKAKDEAKAKAKADADAKAKAEADAKAAAEQAKQNP